MAIQLHTQVLCSAYRILEIYVTNLWWIIHSCIKWSLYILSSQHGIFEALWHVKERPSFNTKIVSAE